ncbi:MAG: GTP cyclohydrolase I FolE [Marinobacter sp.]|nr:GTP cyclohydrolase I FolE [Marinobacter sp.]
MLSREAQAVRDALVEQGLETPMVETPMTAEQKVERITGLMAEVAATLGLDLRDDSLMDTPQRIAKMYVHEIFAGLDYASFPKITQIENKMGVDDMIRVRDIEVLSTCEHHFITIDGTARVAYIPKGKVIGLSKINRIVRFFSQRPQVQERLTQQILVALQTLLEVEDVAVQIEAMHYCVKARGVMDSGSRTETVALGGVFRTDTQRRREFLA